nr:uncharacterized protein LOC122269484 [Parasteatoda tepidariorum]
MPLDSSSILNVSSAVNIYSKGINDEENSDIDEVVPDFHLNEYLCDVTSHIAGFVSRKLLKNVKCTHCTSALTLKDEILPLLPNSCNNPSSLPFSNYKLTQRKNKGGLVFPSPDVVKICKVAEKNIRMMQASGRLHVKHVVHKLITGSLRFISSNTVNGVFNELNDHSYDQDPLNNHKILLMKSVLFDYIKIRLCHIGKLKTQELQRNKCRSVNTKSIIFKGQ